MKKLIAWIMVLALAVSTAALPVLAEDADSASGQTDAVTSATTSSNGRGGRNGQVPGNGRNRQPGGKNSQNAQPPELPENAQNDRNAQAPELPADTQAEQNDQSAQENRQQAPANSKNGKGGQKNGKTGSKKSSQDTAETESFDLAACLKVLVDRKVLTQEQYEQVLQFINALIGSGSQT